MKKKQTVTVTYKEEGKEEKTTVNLYVVRPSNSVVKSADRYRAKTWNDCIRDGVLTKREMSKFLKERGLWDESQDKEQMEISNQIAELQKELYVGSSKKKKVSEGKEIVDKIKDLRVKLRSLISERISFEDNTAESLSDNARFDYLVAECTFYENGERVYQGLEDYNNKSSDEIAFAVANLLAEMMYDIDSDFEKNLPENKWLRQFGLLKEPEEAKEGDELKDVDGNPLDEDGFYVLQVEYEDDVNPKPEKAIVPKKVRRKVVTTDS